MLLFGIISCSTKTDIPQPDVSDIELSTRLIRYEQILSAADTQNIVKAYNRIHRIYPGFTELYFGQLVPIFEPGDDPENFYVEFKDFLTDSRITHLLDTVALVHHDFDSKTAPKLIQAFKYLKYYFPRWVEPNIYTLISEYAFQHFLFEDENRVTGLGIGLDLYLGGEFPYNRISPGNPSFSKYITRTFNKDHIVKRSIDVIYDEIEGPSSGPRMLDQMIDNGKRIYVLNHVLPKAPDSILMEYSAEQVEWVKENEEQIWAFFFKEKLFYETDMIKINKYVNTSPDSPGMPAEAPGMTGNYIGWQIIKAYMDRNPEITLMELLTITDAQKIMDESKYKPKRKK